MLAYIVRRLLLFIPTLFGITLVVFLLLAMAPGGIGAGLEMRGDQVGTNRALRQAYFEDRYGLNDPVFVQYGRWLTHLSPIKFGTRQQVTPAGERKAEPVAPRPPPMPSWFPVEPTTRAPIDATSEDGQRRFLRAEEEFIAARVDYGAEVKALSAALIAYAEALDLPDVRTSRGDCRFDVLDASAPRRESPYWPRIEAIAARVHARYARALDAHAAFAAAFAERPFPEAGVPIIPGIVSLASPDLGMSIKGRPTSAVIGEALPVTVGLNIVAFLLMYAIAVPTGIVAAARRGSWFDVASGAALIALWSVPIVLLGTLAIGFLANARFLHWFPLSGLHDSGAERWTFLPSTRADGTFERGYLLDLIWHACLPIACLAYGGFAILAKQTRAAMLDNFSADYVRTARAKGLDRRAVTMRHVFRNSLLPIITMFVTVFPLTLAGSVVVEHIFSIHGMGYVLLDAISGRDREVILADTLMIACVNLLALLLADILYAAADPRITFE